jgi:hypothetical protein
MPDSTPGEKRRANAAATMGTTSIGVHSASIRYPASISLRPSMPMKRSGRMTSRTTKHMQVAIGRSWTPTKRR